MKVKLIGVIGFPLGLAAVEKEKLIAKILLENNNSVEIVSNNSFAEKKITKIGVFDKIPYRYTCLYTKKPRNKILTRLNKIWGQINELIYLFIAPIDFLICGSRNFFQIFSYYIVIKFRRKKLLLTVVEDKNCMPASQSFLGRIDNFLYQKYVWKMVDGAFPISEELSYQIKKSNPKLPLLKVPALVNPKLFQRKRKKPVEYNYFLFCGSTAYFKTISFIIDSYTNASLKLNSFLVLIVNGNKKELDIIQQYVLEKDKHKKIKIVSNLSYEQLIAYYQNAEALLIPLNFNQQDKARMPHKIGEYCASKRPIISSKWGEVDYYFNHKENALLIDSPNTIKFGNYLKILETDKKLSSTLAKNAYALCLKEFALENYSVKLNSFLISLI